MVFVVDAEADGCGGGGGFASYSPEEVFHLLVDAVDFVVVCHAALKIN